MLFRSIQKIGELKKELRQKEAEKMLLLRYIKFVQCDQKIDNIFLNQNIREFAIYGCNDYSDILYEDAKDTNLDLKYIIAENLQATSKDVTLLTMKEELPKVDAVIICKLFQEEYYRKELRKKGFDRIITFADIVYGKL